MYHTPLRGLNCDWDMPDVLAICNYKMVRLVYVDIGNRDGIGIGVASVLCKREEGKRNRDGENSKSCFSYRYVRASALWEWYILKVMERCAKWESLNFHRESHLLYIQDIFPSRIGKQPPLEKSVLGVSEHASLSGATALRFLM